MADQIENEEIVCELVSILVDYEATEQHDIAYNVYWLNTFCRGPKNVHI